MIVHLDEAKVGSLLFRLVAKTGMDVSRYYVTVRHDVDTDLTLIEYYGNDLAHSERKFGRICDKARAGEDGRA